MGHAVGGASPPEDGFLVVRLRRQDAVRAWTARARAPGEPWPSARDLRRGLARDGASSWLGPPEIALLLPQVAARAAALRGAVAFAPWLAYGVPAVAQLPLALGSGDFRWWGASVAVAVHAARSPRKSGRSRPSVRDRAVLTGVTGLLLLWQLGGAIGSGGPLFALGAIVAAGLSLGAIWGPMLFLAAASRRVPDGLLRDGAHLVGDTLIEVTDQDAALDAAASELAMLRRTIGGRLAGLRELAAKRRVLLRRAGQPEDGALGRMERLAADQETLLGEVAEAERVFLAQKQEIARRVEEVRVQAELVWQAARLDQMERALGSPFTAMLALSGGLSEVHVAIARIRRASENSAAAWKAEGELSGV